MKVNLVCKGGGVKGIALVGAISYLEEKGYEWMNLAGTSGGALIAALLAVGYNSAKRFLDEWDFEKYKRYASRYKNISRK